MVARHAAIRLDSDLGTRLHLGGIMHEMQHDRLQNVGLWVRWTVGAATFEDMRIPTAFRLLDSIDIVVRPDHCGNRYVPLARGIYRYPAQPSRRG